MQPKKHDLRIEQGATLRAILRMTRGGFVHSAIITIRS